MRSTPDRIIKNDTIVDFMDLWRSHRKTRSRLGAFKKIKEDIKTKKITEKNTRKTNCVVIHWAPKRGQNGESFEQSLEVINREHEKFRKIPGYPQPLSGTKYENIAYHFIIGQNGERYSTRLLSNIGYHAGNYEVNRVSIGICLIGDRATVEQLRKLKELLNHYHELGETKAGIYGHCEVRKNPTECPGDALMSWITRCRSKWSLDMRYALR